MGQAMWIAMDWNGQAMWIAMDWNGTGHVGSNGLEWDRPCG